MSRLIDADALAEGYKHMGYDPTEHPEESYMEGWCKGFNAAVDHCMHHVIHAPTIEERKTTIEFPHVFIAEGFDSIKSEDGETGFGVYDPENKQIFIAGAVPDEIFVKALLHELMHWVQDISGCAFSEGEANTFAENIYNTMESYIVTSRWIPCSERVPERGKDVLVTRDYDGREDRNKSCRYVEVASCYGEEDDITWISYSDEYKMTPKNHHVIAWMPLPEPYRKEGEK